MTQEQTEELIDQANRVIDEETEEPVSVERFVEMLLEDPSLGRSAHKYLLDAIEYFGTRTVFERGEEKERYKFFDDPANQGEHAVLGNTDVLNSFVEDLRVIVNGEDRMQKIILFNGPTATGKSELKRCIVNGLRSYSRTEEGKRYTCDWNHSTVSSSRDMTYGDMPTDSISGSGQWRTSPVQVNPVSILPKKVRKEISDLSEDEQVLTDTNLDPFSQKEYDIIRKHYEESGENEIFSSITDPKHVRIRRYTVDETQGIGILTAEDDGNVKERLLGSWMPTMLRELDSVGKKDPRAFSYDGVLSQGNCGVTVVEDATKHADILVHLLNVPDEGHAKIDKEIGFDVDTVPIFISNPDLVDQHLDELRGKQIPLEEIHGVDPLKAIKRRIFQYEIKYLTSLSDESQLLRKEINGFTDNLRSGESDQRDGMEINGTEFSPHTVEAAAMYNVVTRMSEATSPDELTLADKALLYDRGYIDTEKGRKDIDEFEIENDENDGKFGIPVTYTRDVMSSLVHSGEEDVYLPQDALDIISEGLDSAPVFGDQEAENFKARIDSVEEFVNDRQQEDVIESILYDRTASENAVEEYVDNLYAWQEQDDDNYDEYLLKDFEKKHLGTIESQYSGQEPNDDVEELRRDRIISPLNRYHWRERDEEFEASDMELKEVPVLSSILGEYSWVDVFSAHPNLDPLQWEDPPENTETGSIKDECVANMVEMYGYTEESAKMTADRVFDRNRDALQEIKEEVVDD